MGIKFTFSINLVLLKLKHCRLCQMVMSETWRESRWYLNLQTLPMPIPWSSNVLLNGQSTLYSFLILRNATSMSAINRHSSKWYPRLFRYLQDSPWHYLLNDSQQGVFKIYCSINVSGILTLLLYFMLTSSRRKHCPYTFNTLEPYCNYHTARYLIELVSQTELHIASQLTALVSVSMRLYPPFVMYSKINRKWIYCLHFRVSFLGDLRRYLKALKR